MTERPEAGPDGDAALIRAGRRSQWLLLACLVGVPLGLAAVTLLWPRLLALHPALARLPVDPGALDLTGRLAALAALSLPTSPIIWVLWQARRLYQAMQVGRLFTADLPLRLRGMGIALLAAAALRPVAGALLAAIVTRASGGGQPRLVVPVSSDDVGLVVIAIVLIAGSAAAREAVRIADDNAAIV